MRDRTIRESMLAGLRKRIDGLSNQRETNKLAAPPGSQSQMKKRPPARNSSIVGAPNSSRSDFKHNCSA